MTDDLNKLDHFIRYLNTLIINEFEKEGRYETKISNDLKNMLGLNMYQISEHYLKEIRKLKGGLYY